MDAGRLDRGLHGERTQRGVLGADHVEHALTGCSCIEGGGDFDLHASHENGLDVDIRLPRSDGQEGQSNPGNYDRRLTQALGSAVGADKKVVSDKHFVFFNNLVSPDGSVEHTGDNLTGEGEGDDEMIKVKDSYNADAISILAATAAGGFCLACRCRHVLGNFDDRPRFSGDLSVGESKKREPPTMRRLQGGLGGLDSWYFYRHSDDH